MGEDHLARPLEPADVVRAIVCARATARWCAAGGGDDLATEVEAGGSTYRVTVSSAIDAEVDRSAELGLVREPGGVTMQLEISLRGVEPRIWRRVQVPGSITLYGLHRVVQLVMGWHDEHLHEFSFGKRRFALGPADDAFGPAVEDESDVRLDQLIKRAGQKIAYWYDFGDDWMHDILVENTSRKPPEGPLVQCLAGARACPPEDSGGPWGYMDKLALASDDDDDPDAEDVREWLGDHDPEAFSLTDVNRRLVSAFDPPAVVPTTGTPAH